MDYELLEERDVGSFFRGPLMICLKTLYSGYLRICCNTLFLNVGCPSNLLLINRNR